MADVAPCPLGYGPNPDRLCEWCGNAIPPRARRWCRQRCSEVWWQHHIYQSARDIALRRDNWRCVVCGLGRADGVEIEVNHITPIRGRHGEWGCHHHPDGLEVLCKGHHLEVTRLQRARGWV